MFCKRILPLLLICILMLSLCSCGILKSRLQNAVNNGVNDLIKEAEKNIGDLLVTTDVTFEDGEQDYVYFVDDIKVLEGSEESTLKSLMRTSGSIHECCMAIHVTTATSNISSEADTVLNSLVNDRGYEGVALLYVDIGNREFRIVTHGTGDQILDDSTVEDAVRPLLADGEYFNAFCTFVEQTASILGMGKG